LNVAECVLVFLATDTGVGVSQGMPCADERSKPMQGLAGFAAQTRINTDAKQGEVHFIYL
jgi:hypothetical protein